MMSRRRAIRGLVAASVIVLSACGGSPTEPSPTPLTLPLISASWDTISDPHPYPLATDGSMLTFEFPRSGSMHYLFTASPLGALRGTIAVAFQITVTGLPVVFNSLDPQSASCTIPSSVRPFFWANDNGNGVYDRWWSNPRAVTLAPGPASISVPLKPENFSSVNGRFGNADAETRYFFDKALLNVSRLGVTFGGGCSFGHGINVQGGVARFALTEFVIR